MLPHWVAIRLLSGPGICVLCIFLNWLRNDSQSKLVTQLFYKKELNIIVVLPCILLCTLFVALSNVNLFKTLGWDSTI